MKGTLQAPFTAARVFTGGMDLDAALAFARDHRNGVLITLKRDGRPQSSNIVYTVADDGRLRVSITADRAKYANLVRDGRVSLHVNADDFWSYAVLECDAELSAVAADPHDAATDELVALYPAVAGRDHPDWEEYRRAMVTDQRVVLRLSPQRAYGLLR